MHFCEWNTIMVPQKTQPETGSQTSENLSLNKIYEIISFFNKTNVDKIIVAIVVVVDFPYFFSKSPRKI